MYKIRTETEFSLNPILLKQKLRLIVLPQDSNKQDFYYWDERVKTYLRLGSVAYDSEAIPNYTQLIGSIHPICGSIMYFKSPKFPHLGSIQFGRIDGYDWSTEKEWYKGIIDINICPVNKYNLYVKTSFSKAVEQLSAKDFIFLKSNNLLMSDLSFTAVVEESKIGSKEGTFLTINHDGNKHLLELKIKWLDVNRINQKINFNIIKQIKDGYDLEVRYLENGEQKTIGKFTTAPGSKDSEKRLRAAGFITYDPYDKSAQINQAIFNQVELIHSGRDFKLNICDRQKLPERANNTSIDLNLLPAPPDLPGVNISSDSEDYLGQKIATAIGKVYIKVPNSDLEEVTYNLFQSDLSLVESIIISGGIKWLQSCFHRKENSAFAGDAKTSKLIKAIISAYGRFDSVGLLLS
jgi:hypothetical protein